MLHLRTMTAADIPLGMQLKAEAGWNQTEADWRRFLELAPDGCYVAEVDGTPAGTAAAIALGEVAWIAMVLVAAPRRGQGIGTELVRRALADLDRRGMASVRLDATALGRPIYEKLGFRAQFEVIRWEGCLAAGADDGTARPCSDPALLEPIAQLDREVTATRRERLLAALWRQQPDGWCAVERDGRLRGYAAFREGSRAVQVGPAVAATADDGDALMEAIAARIAGRPVFLDVPQDNQPACRWASSRGLTVQRTFWRMVRGTAVCEDVARLWASSGPETG